MQMLQGRTQCTVSEQLSLVMVLTMAIMTLMLTMRPSPWSYLPPATIVQLMTETSRVIIRVTESGEMQTETIGDPRASDHDTNHQGGDKLNTRVIFPHSKHPDVLCEEDFGLRVCLLTLIMTGARLVKVRKSSKRLKRTQKDSKRLK